MFSGSRTYGEFARARGRKKARGEQCPYGERDCTDNQQGTRSRVEEREREEPRGHEHYRLLRQPLHPSRLPLMVALARRGRNAYIYAVIVSMSVL